MMGGRSSDLPWARAQLAFKRGVFCLVEKELELFRHKDPPFFKTLGCIYCTKKFVRLSSVLLSCGRKATLFYQRRSTDPFVKGLIRSTKDLLAECEALLDAEVVSVGD